MILTSGRCWKLDLASSLAIGAAIASCGDCAFAQVTFDATLGAERSVVTPDVINGFPSDRIDGGAIRGANLFHSFQEFNVGEGRGAYFTNPAGIENIISRVTGGSRSDILGTLGVVGGNANLFLINPNGIIFGPNASLDVKGSFVASTASSLNFADGMQFSATAPQTLPLLTVSVPIGLQFGDTAGSIRNQSRATDNTGTIVGLQVQPGQTLALVGGDVALAGGYLTAPEGRLELGSVADPSLVSLTPTDQGLVLGYEGIQNFQDIQLSQQAVVQANGKRGGTIQVQGRRVMLTDGSLILASTLGSEPGGNLTVIASDSVELIGKSVLLTQTRGDGAAGDITITTGKLIVRDGSQVSSATQSRGSGGQLTVTASESVELIGRSPDGINSGLFSATAVAGNAGDITLTTRRLLIQDKAVVSTQSAGINFGTFIPATGQGGDLTVTASESVELVYGQISSGTLGSGDAGNLTIKTGQLFVRDGSTVTVSSEGTGNAGDLEVTARSILLDNEGELTATTESGQGGNIKLEAGDVWLRRESKISTTAGTQGNPGNGGQITINTDTLVGLENSDIMANAFEGNGGIIKITAQGIFGLVQRDLEDFKTLLGTDDPKNPNALDPQRLPSSDITAISQTDPSLRGQVTINRPDVDPSQGLVNLPEQVVDVTGLIAQGCSADGGKADKGSSEFTVTGRGGLPPTPREAFSSDTVLEDWGTLALTSTQPLRSRQHDARENRSGSPAVSTHPTRPTPAPLVEATGWVIGANGEVILTATAPTTTPHSPWLPPATCHGF